MLLLVFERSSILVVIRHIQKYFHITDLLTTLTKHRSENIQLSNKY